MADRDGIILSTGYCRGILYACIHIYVNVMRISVCVRGMRWDIGGMGGGGGAAKLVRAPYRSSFRVDLIVHRGVGALGERGCTRAIVGAYMQPRSQMRSLRNGQRDHFGPLATAKSYSSHVIRYLNLKSCIDHNSTNFTFVINQLLPFSGFALRKNNFLFWFSKPMNFQLLIHFKLIWKKLFGS